MPRLPREVEFVVEQGRLAMRVSYPSPKDRRRDYTHRCEEATLVSVAHAVDAATDGVTVQSLAEALHEPWTAVAVVLAFLDERGVVVHRPGGRRRLYSATDWAFEDAMIEWTALRDGHVAAPATSSM
jgi:hypothetical protein